MGWIIGAILICEIYVVHMVFISQKAYATYTNR